MLIINNIQELRQQIKEYRSKGLSIGFVPTMGYLHAGHLTLMKEAKKACDKVIISIFVNPLQFGVGEDFEEYPRDLTRDSELAQSVGVDIIFAPTIKEMYPQGYNTFVEVFGLTDKLCGLSRPGHFKGVTTVVNKLFNIVTPDFAFFGQKDAQQVLIISKMVQDLNLNVEVVTVPIVREEDGLAMSSRNVFLSQAEREGALILSKTLQLAQTEINKGLKKTDKLKELLINNLNSEPLAQVDYLEILNVPDLLELDELKGKIIIALAVRFGKTRLIDNLVMEV